MPINTYLTKNKCVFSIIQDKAIYDACVSGKVPKGYLYNNGYTSLWDEFKNFINTDQIYTTIFYSNKGTYNADAYNIFADMFHNSVIYGLDAETTNKYFDVTLKNDSSKKMRLVYAYSYGVANFSMTTQVYLNNTYTSDIIGSQIRIPFAEFDAGTIYGTSAEIIKYELPITDGNGKWITLGFYGNRLSLELVGVYYGATSAVNNTQPFFGSLKPTIITDDPYSEGGISGAGGGDGSFDSDSDEIPIPDLPALSSVSTGFVSLFNPTLSQLNELASYMWSDLFDIATFKKIFADPMDVILGLAIVPVSVPSSGTEEVKVGNISTGVLMDKASSQYVQVNCGSLDVGEYWGAYLDYAPYTKAEIYLPYCGTHPIDIDEIMGKTVTVNYNIDILSGACCAMIKCGGSVLYHFLGQCSQPIPVSGSDWTSVIANAVRAAASIGTMLATGGLSTPAAAQHIVSGITSTASTVTGMKPSIEKSGSMSGSGGMLGVQTPYLIFSFPRQCLPDEQNSIIGYPSYIYSQFSSLSGYTIIDDVHLSINSATNQEKDEIESLLKTGVIL